MASRGGKFIRVRLFFDYPPPAVVDCRMCWLLVDLNTCRVVADLESLIREKFEFSRGSILNLFIEDCYLPHTESIFVVRDNDSVRVKVEYLAQVNGEDSCRDKASESCRKRHRLPEEDGPEEKNGMSVERKKKKRKNWREESLEKVAEQAPGETKKKKRKKRKKKIKKAEEGGSVVLPKPPAAAKNTAVKGDEPVKSNKKTPVAPKVSSSDSSSSSSEEDNAPKKAAAQKAAPKTPPSTPASSKTHPTTKPAQSTPRPPLSSTSDTSDSSDEAASLKPLPKNTPSTTTYPKVWISDILKSPQAPPVLQSTNCTQARAVSGAVPPRDPATEDHTSSSEEEIKLVIRRPVHQLGHGGQPFGGRGRGRGNNRRGGPRGRGRGGGRGGSRGQNCSAEPSCGGAKEPSCQSDSLTNTSVVLQNGAESAPEQDYSSMPLLAAPPQVGQKIAFKLLELTENYTPEVSQYKVGKILNFDHATKQIDLELQDAWQAPVEPGKFDLVYQNPDGSERVEFAVSRDSRVIERWDSLLEPRLII